MDEAVLSALALVFKNSKCDEESTECYENAFNLVPNNVNFASELFGCYARGGEFKKMQQVMN